MSARVISEILDNISDTADVTINYYVSPTINNYNYAYPLDTSVNTDANQTNTQGIQTDTVAPTTYDDQQPINNDIDISISVDDTERDPPPTNINSTSYTDEIHTGNTPYTTHINATIDLDNINTVMDLTDALTVSIANSLENIHYINPQNISTEEMLEKTSLIIYKNIECADDKCHICNEEYNEFDICRKNNLCSHYFHYHCIDNWYSRNIKCPICQQVI